jgi:hypothetical protein
LPFAQKDFVVRIDNVVLSILRNLWKRQLRNDGDGHYQVYIQELW